MCVFFHKCSGRFKKGVTKAGYSHLLASTSSLRAAGPATVPMTKLRATIACVANTMSLRSLRHRTVIPVATQMLLPLVCLPPV